MSTVVAEYHVREIVGDCFISVPKFLDYSCVQSVSERHDERLIWHDKVMLRIFCYAAVSMIHVVGEMTVVDEDFWW